jgi:hypothetical protein
MLLTDSYVLHPGQCHLCGGQNLPAADTLKDVDKFGYEGRLYVCSDCAGELAQLFGWTRADQWEALERDHAALAARNRDLEKDNSQLRRTVTELSEAYANRPRPGRKNSAGVAKVEKIEVDA